MKTLLFSYKFLFMTLTMLPLAMCSNDDDNIEQEEPFETVTLDLSDLNVEENDTSFAVNGFTFINSGAESAEFSTTSTINGESIEFKGIYVWNDGTDFQYIELELDDSTEVSKITSRVFNNGTTGTVTLYNNGSTVQEIESQSLVSDIVMNVKDKVFDKLRITSYEGAVISIKLE